MKIRNMAENDRAQIVEMMTVFYASPAVHTNGSKEIFMADIDACISDNPYLEGYIIEESDSVAGYVMVAKSFSTEFGKPCVWLEDLYIKEEYRGIGFGSTIVQFITDKYPHAVVRLEVEEENEQAIHIYKKAGFEALPYTEMIKL